LPPTTLPTVKPAPNGTRINVTAGHDPKRQTPTPRLPDERPERHAEHVREREPREHQRDRTRLFFARHERCGDDGPDTEERSVRERSHDAGDHQHPIVPREGAQDIADDEHEHQRLQRRLARQFARENREQGRTGGDATA